MNTTVKCVGILNLKRIVLPGMMFVGGLGLLWSILYWKNDIPIAIGILFIHVFCGAVLSLCIAGFARALGKELNLAGLYGCLLGVFWVSPILLYKIQMHYYNLDMYNGNAKGYFVGAILVIITSLIGLLVGYYSRGLNRFTTLALVVAYSFIVPIYFILTFPETETSRITIANRLGEEKMITQPQMRVMVLGIDGGTWNVIIPLLQQGKLPNLKALMERGQYGVLLSNVGESWSPIVWTSIFTGKVPEKHGISRWVLSDSRNRFSKSLWNILNEYGQKTITVNIPGTFPPEKVVGAQISGFPIPGIVKEQGRTNHTIGRLYTTASYGLKIVPTTKLEIVPAKRPPTTLVSYSPPYESYMQIVEHVRTEYTAYTLYLENFFLELLDEFRTFQTARSYAQFISYVVDSTDDNTVNYDKLYVFLNGNDRDPVAVLAEGQWSDWIRLKVNGVEAQMQLRLLTLSSKHLEIYATPFFQSSFSPQIPYTYPLSLSANFSKEIGQYVVEGAGWLMYEDELTLNLLYENIESVGTQHVRASEYLLREFADWQLFVHVFTESDRIQHAYWAYFQPNAYPSVDKALVKLHGGKVNSTIEKIDHDIGKLIHYLPDENTTVIVVSDHGFKSNPGGERGVHSWEGMYIFAGKGIKKSPGPLSVDIKSFPRASVLDITPSILHLMGYPVGKDMDGKVLVNVLDEGMLECCPTQFVESYEHYSLNGGTSKQTIDESTKDQLRGLGYMQ